MKLPSSMQKVWHKKQNKKPEKQKDLSKKQRKI